MKNANYNQELSDYEEKPSEIELNPKTKTEKVQKVE